MVPGCSYMAPPYAIPGVGMLTIDSLGSDQVAQRTTSSGTPVLLKGSTLNAKFQVMVLVQQPATPSKNVGLPSSGHPTKSNSKATE